MFIDGWYLASEDASCTDACNKHNLECSEKEFYKHNGDVDSSDEVLNLVEKLGGKTSATWCTDTYGQSPSVPGINPEKCSHSAPKRSILTFECDSTPSPKYEKKQRLCWCNASGK